MENKIENLPVSIDWLQINLRVIPTILEKIEKTFEVIILPFKTRHFGEVVNLKLKGHDYATLQWKPLSKILAPDMMLVKFSNQMIYRYDCASLVSQFISFTNSEFISYSRIDVCVDFQSLIDFKNPEDFIKEIMRSNVLLKGNSKFKCIGSIGKLVKYDYFRIGTENSDISWYMYNKSKELQEVKEKPHIRELWDKSGFLIGVDVWRIEFTLKGSKQEFFDTTTGEIFSMKMYNLPGRDNIKRLLTGLINNKLVCYYNNNAKVKSRQDKVKLLDLSNIESLSIHPSFKTESNNMDRFLLKKINEVNNDLRSKKLDYKETVEELMNQFAEERALKPFLRRL